VCKVLSFVLERHVETLITEPISMDLGFGQVVKVNLLNLFGIDPGQQCRNRCASHRRRASLQSQKGIQFQAC
jgi:hypothetical protein